MRFTLKQKVGRTHLNFIVGRLQVPTDNIAGWRSLMYRKTGCKLCKCLGNRRVLSAVTFSVSPKIARPDHCIFKNI